MQQCIKIYFICIWSSTCFGRHTAHHKEPKTALAASGFAWVEGCWTCSCWTLTEYEKAQCTFSYSTWQHAKPEAVSAVLGSWWWVVCRPKHVELHINMNDINDTLLHLVGFSMWIILWCTDPRTSWTGFIIFSIFWNMCNWKLRVFYQSVFSHKTPEFTEVDVALRMDWYCFW